MYCTENDSKKINLFPRGSIIKYVIAQKEKNSKWILNKLLVWQIFGNIEFEIKTCKHQTVIDMILK